MPHLVKCHLCLTEMSMSDDIFARRIAGRKVSLKCRHCTSTIIVDATGGHAGVLESTSRHGAPAVGAKASTPVAKPPTPAPAAAAPSTSPRPPAQELTRQAPRERVPQGDVVAKPTAEAPKAIAEAPKPHTSATAVTTKMRAIAPVAAPPRRDTPFGGIPAVAPVAAPPRRNTPFGGIPAQTPVAAPPAAPPRRNTPFGGIPAQALPMQAPAMQPAPRVVTPPPFPAVSPAAKADEAQEVSVAELLPASVAPPAAVDPVSARTDDVQEVSVVDLLPAEAPPTPARRAALETLPEVPAAAPEPIATRAQAPITPARTLPVEPDSAALPVAEPALAVEQPRPVETPPAAPEPAASPFAQTIAYGPDSDLTPRAFGFQDPPPAAAPAPQPASSSRVAPPRSRPWSKRAALAAVALVGVAAATVAVLRGGALPLTKVAHVAATTAEAKPTTPAAAAAPSSLPTATATAPATVAPVPSAPAESPVAPAAPEAAPVAATPAEPSAVATAAASDGSGPLPSYVSEPGVRFLTRVAVQRAERTCHRRGRAVGKAQVFATFMPNGRVSHARVEGEPIESAPVARCIKDQLYAVIIPKFDGASFTVSEPITLY